MLKQLQTRYTQFMYVPGERFCWSPETNEIYYDASRQDDAADWSLLHETGHALLDHRSYQADFELLRMEMAAWKRARDLAADFGTTISEGHIQDCLDTYRDWLNKRSICPDCATRALQQSDYAHYHCYNCHRRWRVSQSRFGRAYRSTKNLATGNAPVIAVFNNRPI